MSRKEEKNGADIEAQTDATARVSRTDDGAKSADKPQAMQSNKSKNGGEEMDTRKSAASGKEKGEEGEQNKEGAAKNSYSLEETLMSKQEVADKLGANVNWEQPDKSKGLTEEEV